LRWALEQPDLLQPIMADASWLGWRTLLIAAMGEELTPEERTVFQGLTGRERESGAPVEEAFFIVGRGGKTRAAAVLACHLAVFGAVFVVLWTATTLGQIVRPSWWRMSETDRRSAPN
jgi:hypothetical protein